MEPAERTQWVVKQARALGFDLCGVAPVEGLEELEHHDEWLARGYAGEMDYLRDPRRQSPTRVLEGARSLVVCALNYNTPLPYSTEVAGAQSAPADALHDAGAPRGWISRYAWGDDYHDVLREKLEALLAAMRHEFAEPFDARAYVDTGPVVERVAAKYAGLGWLAKNTCLINPELGSWLFLGVIVTTLDLAPSLAPGEPPQPDLCDNCRLCIDACPTGAIVEPYLLDARRCISYLTIELRGPVPEEFRPAMASMVFGCDICQDVCPWNRKAPVTSLAAFLPRRFSPSVGAQHLSRGEPPVPSAAEGRDAVPAPTNPVGAQPRPESRKFGTGLGAAPVATNPAVPRPADPRFPPHKIGAENGKAKLETRRLGGQGLSPDIPMPGREGVLTPEAAEPLPPPADSLFAPSLEWLASLTEDEFRRVFRASAIKRTKWRGLVRNACIALGNALATSHSPVQLAPSEVEGSGVEGPLTTPFSARILALLKRLAASDHPVISEHALWASRKL